MRMEKEKVRQIVTDVFAKTFDPVFTVRLAEFIEIYREDVLARYDWFKAFGYHVKVEGKERPTFNLLPLEELVINTICNKLEEENKNEQSRN